MRSATADLKPPHAIAELKTLSAVGCTDLLGCPNCKSTNIIKLWRAEIVLPGDNSDNSTKGYRYGCKDCEQTFYSNLNTDSV